MKLAKFNAKEYDPERYANKGLWRVMEGNFRGVSEVPTMKSLDK